MVACFAVGGALGLYYWGAPVRRPPAPSAAKLPASARVLLQPFRKDRLDLALAANGETEYHIAMQAGATLAYSWSVSQGAVSCQFADRNPVSAGEGHGAFVAQSSGWYRWRWKNRNGAPVTIRLKLNGYYEPASMPYDK